ncbi:sigma factor-like helix-turn-helix DNA-binding protein [Rubripirellula tenax]|nr:sigma factor-like helix-turn-helix DNA-binding protein [Rubripirellula tenax]
MNLTEFKQIPEAGRSAVLKRLSYREREIVKLLSGLGDGYDYTLEEVSHVFKETTERIEEFASEAMRKAERWLATGIVDAEVGEAPTMETDSVSICIALPEFCDEQLVGEKLAELYVALNGMHIGAGGSGLTVREDQSDAGVMTLEGAPTR